MSKARWRNRPRMICEMEILYKNGESKTIHSDSTWKTSTGPYIQNNIYSGDTYDACLAITGWDKPGFDDSKWTNAIQVAAPSPLLVSQNMPAIETEQFITPINMRSFGDTVYVYDFGVNMSGVCTLSINGKKGTKVSMQHGELLKDNGRLEMLQLRYLLQTITWPRFSNRHLYIGRKTRYIHSRFYISWISICRSSFRSSCKTY